MQEVAKGHSALPGRFLSRRCFTLCITVEVEPRIEAVQMPILLQLKKLPWKGDGWWRKKDNKNVFASFFFGCPEDREFVEEKKKAFWGIR